MRWDGPICECGHPLDLHWPEGVSDNIGRSCRARGCACGGRRPKGQAEPPTPVREGGRTPPTARREKDWQQAVIDLATLAGWMTYHTHDSRRSQPGFPDLVLVRRDRILYRELKREGNKPTADQRRWLDALTAAGQDAMVWAFPADWALAVETLR